MCMRILQSCQVILKYWFSNTSNSKAKKQINVAADGNWYAIRPLYLHTVDRLANKFTLAHLKTYNMEAGVPVAPEARDSDYQRFGDKFSNFNAGKILLVLEGIGGVKNMFRKTYFHSIL